jgi:hypothetical protein
MIRCRVFRSLVATALLCSSLNAACADGLTSPMPTFTDEVPWTPSLKFGGANVGMTFTAQIGYISRLGNGQVDAYFNIVLSAKGSSTGAATITGLPLTNKLNVLGDCSIGYYSGMVGISTIKLYIGSGSSTITLAVPSATDNNTALLDTAFTATTGIQGRCSFAM